MTSPENIDTSAIARLSRDGFASLLHTLRGDGYLLVGPTARDGAIVYDRLRGVEDLPAGLTDEQEPGRYRLRRRDDEALFGYAVGPHSHKREFFPPSVRLFQIRRGADGPAVVPEPPIDRKIALIGVRSCDLHAIAVQDRVFLEGPHADADYAARRRGVFVVAVNCGDPGGTCFCASMGTGPRASAGFDLALTELVGDGEHRFVVEVGSPAGAALLARVAHALASEADRASAEAVTERAAARMGRHLDTRDIKSLFYDNQEHPRWAAVAERCLGCTSCTLVCPTCFCSTTVDTTDLSGEEATRERRWDSCFTLDHSYVHGGSVRPSLRARYRQWLTHKLASWIDQYGTSGCVGCGRCITWCPVGIDITEETAALRASPRSE
jgi:sulfhydrogenase subunit beta (sulfur reductase)